MKIAVIGADTKLGKLICTDALHRHNEVTAVVNKNDWADAERYTMVESEDYDFPQEGYDAVIDARETIVIIHKGDQTSTLIPPRELDEEGVRLGDYTVTGVPGKYLSMKDLAIAAVDDAEVPEGKVFSAESERAPEPKKEASGRSRYVHEADKGIAGKIYHLVMDNIGEYVAHFLRDDTVLFAKKGEPLETYPCACFHPDEGVWQAGFIRNEECLTLILDEAQRLCTMVIGRLTPLRPVLVEPHEFQFGALKMFNEDLPFRRHGFTDELVGEKICWHYSPYVNITHCYVSESYMRSSLHNMKPLPADAPEAARAEIADREERWTRLFFDEPAQYIRINPHLYLMAMREAHRNRIDVLQGGGDMVVTINTRRVHDYGVGFNSGTGRANMILFSVRGDFDDVKVPFETEPSPYHI